MRIFIFNSVNNPTIKSSDTKTGDATFLYKQQYIPVFQLILVIYTLIPTLVFRFIEMFSFFVSNSTFNFSLEVNIEDQVRRSLHRFSLFKLAKLHNAMKPIHLTGINHPTHLQ